MSKSKTNRKLKPVVFSFIDHCSTMWPDSEKMEMFFTRALKQGWSESDVEYVRERTKTLGDLSQYLDADYLNQ